MGTPQLKDAHQPYLVPGRACGTCMMCCKVPAIEEFAKPPGVWCKHAISGKGCGIYAQRPGSCRAFYCLWMQDAALLGSKWKPECVAVCGLCQQNGVNLQVASSIRDFSTGWISGALDQAQIRRWVADGAEKGKHCRSR